MKKQLQNIPHALRKQILIRLGGTGLGNIMILLILACWRNIQFLLPVITISLTFLADTLSLYYRCAESRYVVICGRCEAMERSKLRKRLKAVELRCDEKSVRISTHQHLFRNIRPGDTIEVYIADSAPVYDHGGAYVITNIMAVRKEPHT